jgi:hypothetical protein
VNKTKMNRSIIKETKLYISFFLAITVLAVFFVILPRDAKADSPSVSVYHQVTSDTTPVLRGTVSDPTATVSVVIIGYVNRTATVSGDGSWSLQLESGEALAEGYYAIGVASVIGSEMCSDSSFIYVAEDYPIELYYSSEGDDFSTSTVLFPDEYIYTSEEEHFTLTFPAGTEVTKTGGGDFDIGEWYAEGVDQNNERILLKLRFGVPDISLSFSHDITITFNVGNEYNGQSLNIFSRSDGEDDEGWEPMNVDCEVTGGNCSFSTSHASYFAISQYNSIAETEEGEMNDNEDDNEKANITSWKAYQYDNDNGVSCKTRVVLEIKGRHFKNNSEVKIGGKKAFSVEKKSSKKIRAKFCLKDLLKVKTGPKRTVSVTNPNTDRKKAGKKINLDTVKYGIFSADDFSSGAEDRVVNIQRALYSSGFLEEQYITGFYGPLTTNAVIEFQKQHGIPATGYVGPLTRAKFEEEIQ